MCVINFVFRSRSGTFEKTPSSYAAEYALLQYPETIEQKQIHISILLVLRQDSVTNELPSTLFVVFIFNLFVFIDFGMLLSN